MKLTPDEREVLRRAVDRMSRRRRLVFLLRWGERMTTREIAITLGMSRNDVRAETRRIMTEFERHLRFARSTKSRWQVWADNTRKWIDVPALVAAVHAGADDSRGRVRLV